MMSGEQQSIFDLVESDDGSRLDWIGLGTDNRRLFDALQDGWLRPQPSHSGALVGVNAHLCETRGPDGNRIPIRAQIHAAKLPDVEVFAFRDNHWRKMPLSHVVATDSAVFWPGTLPLFSASNFCVSSEEQRIRLVSIGKRISNVQLPAISVGCIDRDIPTPSTPPPEVDVGLTIPRTHDAMRGAISMALWAVPRIDPWLDLLTESLSARPQRLSEVAKAVDASWWRFPPWMRSRDTTTPSGAQERLWLAASEVFASPDCKGTRESVDRIAALASQGESMGGPCVFEEWRSTTHRVLATEAAIGHEDWRERPVGLAIQLVLARPEPTTFKTWFDDNRISLPPAVAWSAATLCGLLHGYRTLDIRFRGKEPHREVVAVQSLRMCSGGTHVNWPGVSNDPPQWHKQNGNFILSWGGKEFACKHEQERGKWYAANLENDVVQRTALAMATEKGWPCRQRAMSLGEGVRPISGTGFIEAREQAVSVRGNIRVQLLPDDHVEDVLHAEEFRHLIAVEPGRLAAPPLQEHDGKSPVPSVCVPGLTLIPDFLTEAEELEILREIDLHDWSNELQRRVQHYGWRYDYKSRQIDPSMRLGQLPDWANRIAHRLVDGGYFRDRLPDQVIVNEYCGSQGISPHIDSPTSFSGVVAMVSLLESWEMEFRKRPDKTRVAHTLERRSATILEGEARYKWTHEIRKRKTDPGPVKPGNRRPSRIPRQRRVSLTFRKVINAKRGRQPHLHE